MCDDAVFLTTVLVLHRSKGLFLNSMQSCNLQAEGIWIVGLCLCVKSAELGREGLCPELDCMAVLCISDVNWLGAISAAPYMPALIRPTFED